MPQHMTVDRYGIARSGDWFFTCQNPGCGGYGYGRENKKYCDHECAQHAGYLQRSQRVKPPSPLRTPHGDEIARLTHAGYSIAYIAIKVGVSKSTVVRERNRRKLVRPPVTRIPAETIDRARQMLEDGYGYTETGRTVGVHPLTLSKKFPNYRLSPSDAARVAGVTKRLKALEKDS